MAATTSRTTTGLGWAGLTPFLTAPVALYVAVEPGTVVAPALAAYGLAIVCFLVGSWWGIALLRREPFILVGSNLVVITACLGFVLLELKANLLLQAALLAGTVGLERMHPMFRPQPNYYATLRMRLSMVASLSLLLSAMLL